MLQNYLKIALRNLVKNKIYSTINIVGLAIGMSVSVLILMFVMHEFSYDKFHANHDRIFRLVGSFQMGDQKMQFSSFSAELGASLKRSSSRIKEYVRVKSAVDKVVFKNPERKGESFYEQQFTFSDPSFFTLFSFRMKEGSAQSLNEPYKMVISERAALKYFGHEDPLGKSLIYEGKHLMQVVGIAENPPSNSSINFDFVVSATTFPQLSENNKKVWEEDGAFNTYLLLDSKQSVNAVEKIIKKEGEKIGAFDGKAEYRLEGISTIHLGNNFSGSGNAKLIYIFMGVAVLILFLALFNYMSLTTARATLRAKEVGVRKVVGAGRSGLVKQFYIESVLLCVIAFVIAFVFVKFLSQPFFTLLNLQIDTAFLFSPTFLSLVAGLLVLSAFIAGSYPALVLSGFAPLEVLKGKIAAGQSGSGVRKFFMVLQFTVSIALIICSMVVKTQLEYMQNKKLGVRKDQIISIPLTKSVANNFFPLRNEIRDQIGVTDVTVSNAELFKGYNMFFMKNFTTGKDVPLVSYVVDDNFIKTMGLNWKIQPMPGTWKNRNHAILNEAAIKDLGMKGNPVGQIIGDRDEVAGVVKDFHFSSIQSQIKGMGLFVVSDTTNMLRFSFSNVILYARLGPTVDLKGKVEAIGKIFKKYDQEKPFEYYFLDDAFNGTFKTEMRMSKMFSVFTAFAIFIAGMGLFGLVTFTAETRTREIGIRKVLGASISGIVALLSKDFIKLVFVAIFFAIPIAYYFMDKWLQDFPYRIQIPVWMYVSASLIAVVIALLTISFQSIKAAIMDPVKSLRSE